jgi:NhaP-type Na+/H+ or K+/H+ antiporter
MYELLIVTVAGVIRGSVAFALILTIENPGSGEETGVFIVKSSVLLLVFITTIFLGAIMPSFISACLKRDEKNQKESSSITNTLLSEEKLKEKGERPRSFFKMFDEDYLKPFFIYNYK